MGTLTILMIIAFWTGHWFIGLLLIILLFGILIKEDPESLEVEPWHKKRPWDEGFYDLEKE